MKKILLLILLGLSVTNVKALTYSEWTEEKNEDINSSLIESEVRYRWYKEKIINEEFLKKNEGLQKYIDYDDYILSEYSSYSLVEPDPSSDIIIESKEEIGEYSDADITNIMFRNFYLLSDVYLSEIKVIDKLTNKEIPYTFLNEKYNSLNNNNTSDYIKLTNDMDIVLDLHGKYSVYNLETNISFYKVGTASTKYSFQYGVQNGVVLYSKGFSFANCGYGCGQGLYYNVLFVKNENIKNIYYRYADKLYRKYDVEKEYIDGYFKELNDYIKDESNYKTYYRYITDPIVYLNPDGIIVDNCYKDMCIKINNSLEKDTKTDTETETQVLKSIIKNEIINDEVIEKLDTEEVIIDNVNCDNEANIVSINSEIVNPKTLDNIDIILLEIVISTVAIIICIIFIIKKIYIRKKCRTLNISSFVE